MSNRYPNMIGKADERMLIIAYVCTSQILCEWRRSPVISNLDNNTLKDDAKTINTVAAYVLGTECEMPPTTETIELMQASIDGNSARDAKLRFSMYEYCLTGETSGGAEMFCRCMAEMQQICNLINQQRVQQAQMEASAKVQVATSMIDLSMVKGPKEFRN